MSTPKTKTATVSVPPRATVNITVRFKTNNAPVAGATGVATNVTTGQNNRDLGKTNGRGELKNLKFEPGLVTIALIFKNHRGENMPQAFDTNPSSTTVFQGQLQADEVRAIDVLMVQVLSQVTISVVDSVSGLALGGTKITGASAGVANAKGQFVSGPVSIGLLHTFSADHVGFGPEGGTIEGPASASLDLRAATSVTNSTLEIKLKPIFGKVKSSQITVEGVAFPAFYETFASGFPRMHPTLRVHNGPQLSFPARKPDFNSGAWTKLFDDLPKWAGASEITLEEFVAVFLIFANETGGSFKPIAERGTLSYLFYLNKPPNELAGNQLRARGILIAAAGADEKAKADVEAKVAAWNARGIVQGNSCSNFPGTSASGPTDADITECDFNKYRGRGFVQLTLHPLYVSFLDPSLLAAGLPGSEAMTSAELDSAVLNNEVVYYGMLKTYLSRVRASWSLTNSEQWRQWGLTVAGQNNTPYGDLFQFRAENLFARLVKAARAGQLVLK